MTTDAASRLAELSRWIDYANYPRHPEAVTWGRLSKLSEEVGEVIRAWIGVTGQNPRKGVTHTHDDVRKELLDVAVTALAAYEHMTGNRGDSLQALFEHILFLYKRAEVALFDGEVRHGNEDLLRKMFMDTTERPQHLRAFVDVLAAKLPAHACISGSSTHKWSAVWSTPTGVWSVDADANRPTKVAVGGPGITFERSWTDAALVVYLLEHMGAL